MPGKKYFKVENSKSTLFFVNFESFCRQTFKTERKCDLVAKKKKNGKVYWLSSNEDDRIMCASRFCLPYSTKESYLSAIAKRQKNRLGLDIPDRVIKNRLRTVRGESRGTLLLRKFYGTSSPDIIRMSRNIYPNIIKDFIKMYGIDYLRTLLIICRTKIDKQDNTPNTLFSDFDIQSLLKEFIFSDNVVLLRRIIHLLRKESDNESGDVFDFGGYTVIDTIRMFRNNCHLFEINLSDFNNITDLHNHLSLVIRRLSTANVEYKYDEKTLKRFNQKIGGVEFKLPSCTHDLINASYELNNCVASYSKYHNNNGVKIVLGYIDNDLKVCMEIVDSKVNQALGPNNDILVGDALSATIDYTKKLKLSWRCR